MFLINNYIQTGKQLNLTWSNTIGEFGKVAHWVTLDMDSLISSSVSNEDINYYYTNLRLLEEQLEDLRILPFVDDIISNNKISKIHNLINYERMILTLIENDLKNKGKVSKENVQRIKVLHQGWVKMLSNLYKDKNRLNPFSPIFIKQNWENTWNNGLRAFDETELIPLPENQE